MQQAAHTMAPSAGEPHHAPIMGGTQSATSFACRPIHAAKHRFHHRLTNPNRLVTDVPKHGSPSREG